MPPRIARRLGDYLGGVFGFEVVVNQHDERERKRFDGEKINGLFDLAVEDAEVGLLQVGDEFAELVLYGDRENDEVGVDANSCLGFAGLWGVVLRVLGRGCVKATVEARP